MEQEINLKKDLFTPLTEDEKKIEVIVRPSVGYWKDAWNRLKKNKMAIISLLAIIIIMLAAIFVPMTSKYSYDQNMLSQVNLKPSAEHWFGTDQLGRDIFVRVFFGARYSLIIGVAAAFINLFIGVLYGGISGFCGGKIDNLMMRIVDVLYSIPLIIYVIILMTILNKPGSGGSGLSTIVLALSISYWIGMARIVRGDVLQLKQQEFVLAAKALGASNTRILIRHLIPNCIGSIMVTMTLLIPQAIFTEAFLSFIGLGLVPPKASLGTLANEAMKAIYQYPYQLLFPAVAICLIILAFNLFGDGLSEALDPKNKR
ncbi:MULTISPECIES: ABC transporter permease [Clostridium]|uniref:Oligopeptide transport system permease protein OppC n=1 Tax=Clostridium botulinum (strain Eklund 17B / Type B) TaxID=935198 RepID=B2TS73_CLOBB|nr:MULTISPECIES: ABC transporter permease [Clostridium]ACD24702.1 oligopeptide transport system permease protein OppC [Clostridium botulinum B str. Eklund 17B (NRP)]MBN1045983.1 ABC transporter permease [Clostridium botulinum]MBN1052743.1 ABC transporter permease [Clostridium botulinum]MBN1055910.1 ABC transporter permease [Clostridium botulinum]MBY6976011.1 ABC transporter permease [Clostridium botulinum]